MRLGKREILYTYICGPYAGATEPHWHGSTLTPIRNASGERVGERSEGNGLHMTLSRALLWLVSGR